jgi:hypothetical protein
VGGNTLSGANGYGREVLLSSGTFNLSGGARPERVFFQTNTRFITINGALDDGAVIPIDLGVTTSTQLMGYVDKPILKLGSSYTSGDMAALKNRFALGNAKMTASPYTETAIAGYVINDTGYFVVKPTE